MVNLGTLLVNEVVSQELKKRTCGRVWIAPTGEELVSKHCDSWWCPVCSPHYGAKRLARALACTDGSWTDYYPFRYKITLTTGKKDFAHGGPEGIRSRWNVLITRLRQLTEELLMVQWARHYGIDTEVRSTEAGYGYPSIRFRYRGQVVAKSAIRELMRSADPNIFRNLLCPVVGQEPQRRGAPHLHILLYSVCALDHLQQRILAHWCKVCAGAELIRNRQGSTQQFARIRERGGSDGEKAWIGYFVAYAVKSGTDKDEQAKWRLIDYDEREQLEKGVPSPETGLYQVVFERPDGRGWREGVDEDGVVYWYRRWRVRRLTLPRPATAYLKERSEQWKAENLQEVDSWEVQIRKPDPDRLRMNSLQNSGMLLLRRLSRVALT